MRFLLVLILICQINSWCFRTSLSENSAISEVDWAPDNSIFVSASKGDKVVRIYNASTFELLSIYNNTNNIPTSVKISKDSKWIGIGYANSDLHIVNAVSPFAQYWTISGGHGITEIDFSYDNKTILTCGSDRKYEIYNITPKSLAFNSNIPGTTGGDNSVACKYGPLGHAGFSDVNKDIFVMDSSRSNVYNVAFSANILGIDFKPGSGDFGTVSQDNKLRIPNSTSSSAIPLFTDTGSLNSISIGRKGNYFAFGGISKTLFIYDQSTNTIINTFNNLNNTLNSVKISPDQNFIITGDNSGEVRIYTLKCNLTCQSGEYNDTGVCKKCSDAINQCQNCKSNSSCSQCIPGFYLSGGSCIACYINLNYCLQCNSSSQCLKCLDGFYLSGGQCVKCGMVGCLECNDSLTCTKCFKNDFYLNTTTNACVQCADTLKNCIRCADSATCVNCHLGFYVNITTNKCDQCLGNCLVCQSNSNCTECKAGYWSSGGMCIRCTDLNCNYCNQTGLCYDCKEDMYLTATNTCANCVKPCSTCSVTGTNCTECIIGYYFDSVNFQCKNCISDCQVCNDSVKCMSCFLGFKLDSISLTCKLCSLTYGNCSQCSQSQCFKCIQGFYLDVSAGNTCKRCIGAIPNCISCQNSSICLNCITSYFLTGTSSCGVCPAGCSKCVSGNNCTECFSTYFLNTSLLCSPCQSNCFQCTSTSSCNSCVIGYYLDITTCKSCQSILSYCTSCVEANTCISCTLGSYLVSSSKKCSLCMNNCLTCNETDCYSCKVGFYVDMITSPMTCKGCNDSCEQCTSANVCTSCIDGFYLDSVDNKCKSCSAYFSHCTLCNKTNCFECVKGTALNISTPNTCTFCTNFISSCKVCYWDNSLATPSVKCQFCNYGFGLASNNLSCLQCNSIEGCTACSSYSKCTNCKLGYYLKPDNTCGICPQKCFTCDNSLTCLSCKEGFVNDTTDCVLCETKIDGCSKCIYDTGANYNCTFCQVGYFLEPTDKKCYICLEKINGCYTCNDSFTCTGCLDKYFLDAGSGSCKKCVETVAGCQLCNSSNICISCADSYYLDASTSKCFFCSDSILGCFLCQSSTQCSQCEAGYYLHADKTCRSCQAALQGCVYCNSATLCIQCRAGFYLNTTDNKCHQCTQPGCDICDQSNLSNCLSCNNRFFLNGNACSDCINLAPYCYECNNTQCLLCQVGFYLASPLMCTQCSSTMRGCSRCNDGTTCLECMSSYFVNGSNLCQQCNQVLFGCQNCLNESVCISCVTNFFLNSTINQCQPCTDLSGCMLCKNESTCLLCQEKYYLDGSQCKLCSADIKGCFSCVSSSVCVQCQSGYVLDTVSYECKVNTIQVKQKVEGLKLVSYYVNPEMLKHILLAKGIFFKSIENLNITASGMTQLALEDYAGKEVKLKIFSYQFEKNGYSIDFYTDNPLGSQINLSNNKMSFRRLFNEERILTEQQINLKIFIKMDQDIYKQILPDLDYSGSMTVGYSLNDPEFTKSYFSVEAGKEFFVYEIIGIVFISLFLINYVVKFMFTLPNSRNRHTLLPHIIALKACCLIIYPSHFEYLSFCKGFMIVDFYWFNDAIGSQVANLSDTVTVPFGLFFDNMSIGGTFLLGLGVYIFLVCAVQCWFYLMNDQKKKIGDQCESSQKSEEEEKRKEKEFRIQNVEQMIGVNYDNDESEGNKYMLIKRNLLQLLWNIFAFSVVYYSCLSVQGAFYNYQQIITINGVFYILGMLLYIFIAIETFYSFIRNMKLINKVRIFIKACLLSLSYLNPIYVTSVCVAVDIMLIIVNFNVINNKNQLSKFLTVSHILSTISILFMIFISQSLISLFLTGIFLLLCLALEIYIHVKEYLISHSVFNPNQLSPDRNQQAVENKPSQLQFTQNVWNVFDGNYKKKLHSKNLNGTLDTFNQSTHELDNFLMKQIDLQHNPQKPLPLSKQNISKQEGRRSRIRNTQQKLKSSLMQTITSRNQRNNKNFFDLDQSDSIVQ